MIEKLHCIFYLQLPNDTQNWLEFRMAVNKGVQLKLKENVLPHKKLKEDIDFSEPQKKVRKVENQRDDLPSTSGSTQSPERKCQGEGLPQLGFHFNKIYSSPCGQSSTTSSNDVAESTSSMEFTDEEATSAEMKILAEQRQNTTVKLIEHNSRFYLGLEKPIYILVKFITDWQDISYRNVLITLKKIRLDDVYFRLGVDFGVSAATVQRAFIEGVKKIANVMQNFIFSPTPNQILHALPMPFRFRYSSVSYIIDCFEIEIEKPSNPVHQSFSWSEYKKCNTAKYLLSATPHGFINFVSAGFGGRISDNAIITASGYMKILKNCSIMADRGFKNVATLLATKNCQLIRPPSVGENILTKEEVKQAKRIAALRIHIERSIVRVRGFKMLDSHAKINTNMLDLLDEIVIIVCGLINLQGPLIK